MRINQNIPDDMPLQHFDFEDAAYVLVVKPDGSWGIDIRDDNVTMTKLAAGLMEVATQILVKGEEEDE